MAYIKYIDYADADAHQKKVLEKYGGENNQPDNIIRISSVNPAAMEGHISLYRNTHRGSSPVTRLQREMIAVTVSGINSCHY